MPLLQCNDIFLAPKIESAGQTLLMRTDPAKLDWKRPTFQATEVPRISWVYYMSDGMQNSKGPRNAHPRKQTLLWHSGSSPDLSQIPSTC